MAKAKKGKHVPDADEQARIDQLLEEGWTKPVRASGGEIQEWEAGKVVIGTFLGMKKLPDRSVTIDGVTSVERGGHLFKIKTGDETETYGAPTMLVDTLSTIEAGTTVRIECLGKVVPSRRGQPAWDFDVSTRAR